MIHHPTTIAMTQGSLHHLGQVIPNTGPVRTMFGLQVLGIIAVTAMVKAGPRVDIKRRLAPS